MSQSNHEAHIEAGKQFDNLVKVVTTLGKFIWTGTGDLIKPI